jgi:hypothetical protein
MSNSWRSLRRHENHPSTLGIETTVSELFSLIEITDSSSQQNGQWKCKHNIEARSRNHFCHAQAISIKYSECVSVAIVIQRAKRMRRIILLPVTCPALPYFSTLFGGKKSY